MNTKSGIFTKATRENTDFWGSFREIKINLLVIQNTSSLNNNEFCNVPKFSDHHTNNLILTSLQPTFI